MVTTDDLIEATRDVVPSVSKKDLALYKDMKDKYCNLGGLLPSAIFIYLSLKPKEIIASSKYCSRNAQNLTCSKS
jgi:hypothetical protein